MNEPVSKDFEPRSKHGNFISEVPEDSTKVYVCLNFRAVQFVKQVTGLAELLERTVEQWEFIRYCTANYPERVVDRGMCLLCAYTNHNPKAIAFTCHSCPVKVFNRKLSCTDYTTEFEFAHDLDAKLAAADKIVDKLKEIHAHFTRLEHK